MRTSLISAAVSLFLLSGIANANICKDLFLDRPGQVSHQIDTKKARLISKFYLTTGSVAEGALQRQVMRLMTEYGSTNFQEAITDTDDDSILVTIAQSKETRRLYTMIQAFMGDTETGKVFSFYSSKAIAELGDGDCRQIKKQ